ncbi:hypothetical protein E4U30_003108 [Claviceps sp. LM220 group G6]|nr:hypothetical protein E4U32_005466 [Claviceps aff. humidiphila group G2b]KAG6094696.1 hypothetical protein E4U30_003108 [Claviceps sp. LM220 group G6]
MSSTSMNTVRKSLNVTQINFTQGPREGRYNSKADMSKKPDATEDGNWEKVESAEASKRTTAKELKD